MANIHVLPREVAELIAAGEVIDRPASIAKELVENALDAGATRIAVELRHGGLTLLRVTDNGCGIEKEQLPVAFIRHATSKITTESDLDGIGTLGFRGEALPSVAAVSRVRLTSRPPEAEQGYCYTIEGGIEGELYPVGTAVGTTVEVQDLFFNTPARLKFLKKDVVEGNAVAALLDRLALANPSVSFTLLREGKRTLQTPGDGDLRAVIRLLFGAEIAASMLPVSWTPEGSGIGVSGMISAPSIARSSRAMQSFFINSRFIHSKTCVSAVEEAYKNRLMVGRFPACVLNLRIDSRQVDVNVHPAKLEVRFSSEREVYQAIYSAAMTTLSDAERPISKPKRITPFSLHDFDYTGQQVQLTTDLAKAKAKASSVLSLCDTTERSFPTAKPAAPTTRSERLADIEVDPLLLSGRHISAENSKPLSPDNTVAEELPIVTTPAHIPSENIPTQPTAPPVETIPDPPAEILVLGELFDTYIVVQQGERAFLIDKHAAHERYLYNQIRSGEYLADRQIFLAPRAVSLAREEYFALTEHPEALSSMGIVAEDFGDHTLLVRELPMIFDPMPLDTLVGEIARRVLNVKASVIPTMLDSLLYSVCCRAAVMAGKKSAHPELVALAKAVLTSDSLFYCPHGRPTRVEMTREEIEKIFGRMG